MYREIMSMHSLMNYVFNVPWYCFENKVTFVVYTRLINAYMRNFTTSTQNLKEKKHRSGLPVFLFFNF